MKDLTKAVYTRMVNDSSLLALLGQHRGNPTIFVDQMVPAEAPTPYVHSSGNVAEVHEDTKLEDISEALRDVTVIVDRGDEDTLFQITQRIHDLFHRHALAIDDAKTLVASVLGPVNAPTDANVSGSVLTLRLKYEATA